MRVIRANPVRVLSITFVLAAGTGDAQGDEAISRAVTVVNRAETPPVFREAISRAVTLINRFPPEPLFSEAISR